MWRHIVVVSLLFALSAYTSDVAKIRQAIDSGNVDKVVNLVKDKPEVLRNEIRYLSHTFSLFQYTFVKEKWNLLKQLLDKYSLDQLGARKSFTHPSINPKRQSEGTGSVLHFATDQRQKEIIEKLIEKGLDPVQRVDPTRETPLHIAARKGYEDIVQLLLSYDAVKNNINVEDREDKTPLKIAKEEGRTEVVNILQKYGAKEQPSKQEQDVKKSPQPSANITTLKKAIENDNAEKALQFLQEGKSLGPSKEYVRMLKLTPLQFAVYSNAYNVVDALLEKYTLEQLHARESFRFNTKIRSVDFAYVHLVHVPAIGLRGSAVTEDLKMLQRLVEAGLDPMARVEEYKFTPLHIAAYLGRKEIVDYLLNLEKVKNNINARAGDPPSKTALDMAYIKGNHDIVSLLEEQGAKYVYYEEKQQEVSQAGYTRFPGMSQQTVQKLQESLRNLAKHLHVLRDALRQ